MRQPAQPITLNRRFGSLVVKRILDDGTVFCLCLPEGRQCGRNRTATRLQLTTHSVKACQTCAKESSGRQHRPPMPEPDPVVVEPLPECSVKIINGEVFPMCRTRIEGRQKFESHDPDCQKLNLFKLDLRCGQRAGV